VISPRRLILPQRLVGWRGPAIGVVVTFVACLVGAAAVSLIVIAGIKGTGFELSSAVGLLVYGGLGVGSAGKANASDGLAANAHYSLSVTVLGAFVLMLVALTCAGWLASRFGGPEERGTVAVGAKTAVLFGLILLAGSFAFGFLGMHPRHVEAFAFPFAFGLLFCSAGARIERDGYGFWRQPVQAQGARGGWKLQVVQAIGSGFDGLVTMVKLTTVASVFALVVLAVAHPHEAGWILSGRKLVTEILLVPLWLPHVVGVMWLAAQGVSFHLAVGGGIGSGDGSLSGSAGPTLSIYGANYGIHVPGYFVALLLVPLASGLWGGYLAAGRRGGRIGERLGAALWASIPFLLLTWFLDLMVGAKALLGVLGVVGEVSFGPVAVSAIFWPLLWGPALYGGGALLQAWRAGALRPAVDEVYQEGL
jgi:hypothetical protein